MLITSLWLVLNVVQTGNFELRDGDLLFQDLDCGPLCDAIEEVTQGIDSAKFSHIGLVIKLDSGVFVLEAISAGVVLTPLKQFLNRSFDELGNPKVIAGRLRQEYRHLIPEVKAEALAYLGASYDTLFLMNNSRYYCSELIYLCFSKVSGDNNFFPLLPMTFKPAMSEEFFPAWLSYYEAMHSEIPEGEPGLNPGGISCSEKLEIVHVYGIPRGYQASKIK